MAKNRAVVRSISNLALKFTTGGDALYRGQWDGWIVAYDARDKSYERPLGRLDWQSWKEWTNDEPPKHVERYRVKMVEVEPSCRRHGIATDLYKKLFEQEGITEAELVAVSQTPEGAAFRKGARFRQMRSRKMRDETEPLAALILATSLRYPPAGDVVDGLTVRQRVPNLDSIYGYFAKSKTLSGIRAVPMSDLGGPRSVFYAADDFARSERLADAIGASGEINPLIIGVDEKGPFIIEGAHRFVALWYLKVKEFPAVVVVGED